MTNRLAKYVVIGGLMTGFTPLADTVAQDEPIPVPDVVWVEGGSFIAGSDANEREAGYQLDEQGYGHSVTRQRGWYDRERPRQIKHLDGYWITRTAITNHQYEAMLLSHFRAEPSVERAEWNSYGLIHPFERTAPYQWSGGAPAGRESHPVVLVTIADAHAYAGWLSERTGQHWRLPTELEWEKAARGVDGRYFPWGNGFDPDRLNSHDAGPFSTVPVGGFPNGASPYGALDMAGQIFEWTSSPANPGRFLVKGGSWDDKGCGVCRAAARHARPEDIKHILIGFRLIREADSN